MKSAAEPQIQAYVDNRTERLTQVVRDLVRIPSVNQAPTGGEFECQQYVAQFLRSCGWDPVLYTPDEAPGIHSHRQYWPGREYAKRPNIGARFPGPGGGRSLVLSGHVDTVPVGADEWTSDPFGGEVQGNRLYGRGANDMKGGIATNLFVVEALRDLDIRLRGDLVFETVVDEEFGGVNGTLAGRLMGFNADAAVISEPSFLRICPAQRGGRTAHITLTAPNEGILGASRPSVVEQLRVFLNEAAYFAESRRGGVKVHPMYSHLTDPVPAAITRIQTAPWGTAEPTNIPGQCRVEFFWQAMPGETQESIDREFFEWFESIVTSHAGLFENRPQVEFPIRWLPGSAIAVTEPLVSELRQCAAAISGSEPLVQGIEGPCDMYIFHEFGIPAVLWGGSGGNTHRADEYVEIDSLVESAKVLLSFICRWCGVQV